RGSTVHVARLGCSILHSAWNDNGPVTTSIEEAAHQACGRKAEAGMTFKDHFSRQAADYAKFRPGYPQELFDYLGSIAPSHQLAWDCGTGNGQAAVGLASVFDHVIATDASEKKIANAQPDERVEYRVASAEESGLESGTIDLIMVAQALHWFDLPRFYEEVPRVLKSKGVFCLSVQIFPHYTRNRPAGKSSLLRQSSRPVLAARAHAR